MIPGPQALIAELTHRCPLHCVYCSNPAKLESRELSTETWKRVIQEAAALGCWHLHLTGGEPLARKDTEELVCAGRDAGLYVNLITSGLGLSQERLRSLATAGLDHIQLSFQDSREDSADRFAGTRAHARKLQVAEWIRQHRLAFTVNMVVHRGNLDRLEELIALAETLRADKLEIAHVQYYGWAFENRERLLPTRAQLESSIEIVARARERLKGAMRIDFVLPDYYAKYPKACMGGWGRGLVLIDPAGRAMPCHAAAVIPDMNFESVEEQSLRSIWESSPAFTRFRGDDWMQEPCRSCERKSMDFGGCRCQAMLLAGDANATDPVCTKSGLRTKVDGIVEIANQNQSTGSAGPWVYRIAAAREPVLP
ncbi:MAG TPA: pyrroloquinoline quinone biosynthesis protein PqqE [Acidobacteriaceae bacterium]|nr:pyrroloquinoline quinone biosynthesis protein PqqE [Acidobacteriaceae bacterium]